MTKQLIKAYHNGEEISTGDLSNALKTGYLNATDNEVSNPLPIEIKCIDGYKTLGNTSLSFVGSTASKWSLCATESGLYASTLSITETVTNAGITVYAKAKATADEMPVNDTTVNVRIQANIAATE